jgi:hypothetical protein
MCTLLRMLVGGTQPTGHISLGYADTDSNEPQDESRPVVTTTGYCVMAIRASEYPSKLACHSSREIVSSASYPEAKYLFFFLQIARINQAGLL